MSLFGRPVRRETPDTEAELLAAQARIRDLERQLDDAAERDKGHQRRGGEMAGRIERLERQLRQSQEREAAVQKRADEVQAANEELCREAMGAAGMLSKKAGDVA